MSRRDKTLLAVIGVIVVIGGAFYLIVKPKRAELKSLDAQVTQAQSRLAGANGVVAQEQAARARLGADLKGLLAVGKAVPTTVAMPALLQQLQDAASSRGVTVESLTTSDGPSTAASTTSTGSSSSSGGASATPGVTSQSLSLQFDGAFLDLQRFLTQLQSFVDVSRQRVTATGRLMSLDKVHLSVNGGGGSSGSTAGGLTAQVDATIYTLQPSALTGAGSASATPGAQPAGAATSTPTPTATAEAAR